VEEPDQHSLDAVVSVIIPALHEAAAFGACASALRAQTFPKRQVEVLVVDNGPAHGAQSRIEELLRLLAPLPAKVLNEPRRGSYRARNAGVAASRGRILAFTDADCIPAIDWLQRGVDHLERHPRTDAAAGRIQLFVADDDRRTGSELYELFHAFPQERYVADAGFGATANLFLRRSAFDRLGGFDASLASGGDADLGRRLHAAGMVMDYVGTAVVRHPARRNWRELRAKIERTTPGALVLHYRSGASRWKWLQYSVRPLRPPVRLLWRSRHDARWRSRREFARYTATLLLVRITTTRVRLQALIAASRSNAKRRSEPR
jgi:cellulose synthase/poly-beta-1,6-N-acetylglucosamine synthase-like glycosyltransferase